MVHQIPFVLAAASLLLPPAIAEGMYLRSSPVLQVTGSNYQELIANSNHTTILEFYAPWCGHCQNLKGAYEKAAKSLTGLAKVAAVNCDEEPNKPFCGSMGVQGFPTLKIVKPGKKPGKPFVEDYRGERSAKAIVDAVIEKIPNHVKRLKDDDYEAWLDDGDGAKAILFSEKGTTSALLKAIAIDFLGSINVAQIRDKEAQAVQKFDVDDFPTLVLIPGKDQAPITYEGEMKKEAMVKFLSQAAPPNPDPAPKKAKSSSTKSDKSKASKASSSFSKASEAQASSQAKTDKASQTQETLEEQSQPTESPDPNVVTEDTQTPVKLPEVAAPIPTLPDGLLLQQKCLNTKAGTCILALLPSEDAAAASPEAIEALASLAEIAHKHSTAKRNLFPFYQLPTTNSQAETLREQLHLGSGIELIALNGKRAWYRHYTPAAFDLATVEAWIDSIRMGDGAKEIVPEGLIMEAKDLPPEPEVFDASEPVAMNREQAEAMKEKLKSQVPEGVDFELEEIDDVEYERILEEGRRRAEEEERIKDEL